MIFLYKNIKIYSFLLTLVLLMGSAGQAAERVRVTHPEPARLLSLECVTEAARRNGLPLAALLGILATEGGQPGEALSNANGTWDLGPFQVNTCHVNELAKLGIAPSAIMTDACLNAAAAAWLLRQELNRSSGDIWEAVGAYHSRTAHYHRAYIARVKRNLGLLSGRKDTVVRLIEYANGQRRSWQ